LSTLFGAIQELREEVKTLFPARGKPQEAIQRIDISGVIFSAII